MWKFDSVTPGSFLSRRGPDCGIPMLGPVVLRFGSLRPAPGSRHLPMSEFKATGIYL